MHRTPKIPTFYLILFVGIANTIIDIGKVTRTLCRKLKDPAVLTSQTLYFLLVQSSTHVDIHFTVEMCIIISKHNFHIGTPYRNVFIGGEMAKLQVKYHLIPVF